MYTFESLQELCESNKAKEYEKFAEVVAIRLSELMRDNPIGPWEVLIYYDDFPSYAQSIPDCKKFAFAALDQNFDAKSMSWQIYSNTAINALLILKFRFSRVAK